MFPALLALSALLPLAAQDDRTRILDGVESWYRVEQDGKNKGYVHEKLERIKDQWSYAYQADFEIDVKGGWHLEYRGVEATLDEELAPTLLTSETLVHEAREAFTITSEDDKRTLVIPVPGRPDRRVALGDTDTHALPTLLFYSMRQTGRLAKAGPLTARVLVPRVEGRIDSEVSFEAGEVVRRVIAGKSGPLTPVTFLKPPAAAHPETQWAGALVDKYGRLAEVTLRGGAKFVLVEDDLEAFRRSVVVHRSGRRDPFPKKPAMDELKNTTPFPEEEKPRKVTSDNLASMLDETERMLKELQTLKEAGRPDEELREAYLKLLRHWKSIRFKAQALGLADALKRLDGLREGAEAAWDGARRALADARRCSVRIADALDRVDVGALERELRALKDQRGRIELEQRPELEEVLKGIAQAEPMLARVRTRDELAKKAVWVTGTVLASSEEPISIEVVAGVRQNVRFVRDRSTAAINGKSYSVGDVIEDTGVRLEKVSSRSVTVSLRGELREVPIGGK